MNNLFLYLTLAAYAAATGLSLAFFLAQRERYHRLALMVLTVGLAAHSLAIIWRVLASGYLPAATFADALLLFGWALVGGLLILTWRYPIKVLGVLVGPLALLMVAGTLFSRPGAGPVPPLLQSSWLALHVLLTFLGYAALALAFLGGIFYLIQERQIKGKKFGFFYRRLPSLDQLDTLNYWCLTVGFPLLTAGMVSGALYAHYSLGRFWSWDPKEILTLFAWLIYAVLLHERLAVGWRGRRAALLAICGFLVLICTFVGANLWITGYHSFAGFAPKP